MHPLITSLFWALLVEKDPGSFLPVYWWKQPWMSCDLPRCETMLFPKTCDQNCSDLILVFVEENTTSHGLVRVMHFVHPAWFISLSKLELQFSVGLQDSCTHVGCPNQSCCSPWAVYECALPVYEPVCCSAIPCNTKTWGWGWNEDRMAMFIAEIPHSNTCHLHYCQINSELLHIIHCLAWGKWNGVFASLAEMRVVKPSEEPCRLAKEMSNNIWSKSIAKVL